MKNIKENMKENTKETAKETVKETIKETAMKETIKETIKEALEKVLSGEIVILVAEGCSLKYLRNVIHNYSGNFGTSIIKGTNKIKVYLRSEKSVKIVNNENNNNENEEEEDFLGF